MKPVFFVSIDGYIGMVFGSAGAEKVAVNVDSLWTGGPFEATVS